MNYEILYLMLTFTLVCLFTFLSCLFTYVGGLFTFPECLFTFSSSLFTPSLFISLIVCFYLQVIYTFMFNRDNERI